MGEKAVLKYSDYKKQLDNNEYSSIYLFEGEDAFFREHALNDLVNKVVSEKDLNFVLFDGDNFDIDALLSSVSLLPFMSEKRVTAIREFYPDKKQTERLKDIFDNPYPDSIFVIVNTEPCDVLNKFDSVSKVDCGKAEPNVIAKWIKVTCSKYGAEITPSAVNMIIEYCLSDMARIECEVRKLCDYVGIDGTIDEEIADSMVIKDTEFKIYELTDCIGKRKNEQALYIINELLGKGETYQRLLISIYNYFRRLLFIAISDKSDSETASLLNIKEYALKKAKEQTKYFKVMALKKAVDILSDSDYAFKSGKANIEDSFWISLFNIMLVR